MVNTALSPITTFPAQPVTVVVNLDIARKHRLQFRSRFEEVERRNGLQTKPVSGNMAKVYAVKSVSLKCKLCLSDFNLMISSIQI